VSYPGVENREGMLTGMATLKDQGDKDMQRFFSGFFFPTA